MLLSPSDCAAHKQRLPVPAPARPNGDRFAHPAHRLPPLTSPSYFPLDRSQLSPAPYAAAARQAAALGERLLPNRDLRCASVRSISPPTPPRSHRRHFHPDLSISVRTIPGRPPPAKAKNLDGLKSQFRVRRRTPRACPSRRKGLPSPGTIETVTSDLGCFADKMARRDNDISVGGPHRLRALSNKRAP